MPEEQQGEGLTEVSPRPWDGEGTQGHQTTEEGVVSSLALLGVGYKVPEKTTRTAWPEMGQKASPPPPHRLPRIPLQNLWLLLKALCMLPPGRPPSPRGAGTDARTLHPHSGAGCSQPKSSEALDSEWQPVCLTQRSSLSSLPARLPH